MNSLPHGWTWTTLGDVAEPQRSQRLDARPVLTFKGLRPGGLLLLGEPKSLTGARAHPGDVVMTKQGHVGGWVLKKVALIPGHLSEINVATTLQVVRPSAAIDPRWLFYWLTAATTYELVQALVGERNSITMPILRSIPVPIAPLPDQRSVVEALEHHLSRLDAGDRLLAKSSTRLKSLRHAALDAATRASAVDIVPLRDVVERIEAGKSFGSASRTAADDEWGIIKVSAMTWGEFRPSENKAVGDTARVDPRFEILPGDLLVSRANTTEYVGAPVLVGATRRKLLLSDKSLRLVPRTGWASEYLLLLLSAPSARAQMSALATGTKDSMRNISQGQLLGVQVPVVLKSDQAKVIEAARVMLDAIAEQSTAVMKSRRQSTALRRTLFSSAFSGQLTGRRSRTDQFKVATSA